MLEAFFKGLCSSVKIHVLVHVCVNTIVTYHVHVHINVICYVCIFYDTHIYTVSTFCIIKQIAFARRYY